MFNKILFAIVGSVVMGVFLVVTPELSEMAKATLVGVFVGVAASVPTCILLMALLHQEKEQNRERPTFVDERRQSIILVSKPPSTDDQTLTSRERERLCS